MQLKKTVIGEPPKTFLAIPDHYVNVTGLYQASKGEVLKAGTVVKLEDDGTVTKASSNDGNGIVFNDTEPTNESSGEKVNVTVLIHGFVRKTRLDSATSEHLITTGLIAVVE